MASGQSQVSSETIEKTKQQIRGLVGEIAQLAKSEMQPDEFYSAFLQRVVQALAAKGGAIWILGEGKKPELAYQIDISPTLLDKESDEAGKHFKLLDYIIATGAAQLVPPLSGAGDERMGGNPTRHLLVIHPLGHDNQVEGLVEIFQRADTQPNTQRGYLQFMKQMCELTGEWFKNRKLRDLGDRHSLWSQADAFARQVHESLDVRETSYTIVNEGRRLLGCDRVSIGILRGGKCVIDAVSGQDTLDNRSNVVTLLGKLATRVVASGEPLWYGGSTEDLPPQIEEAIEEYVDQSYTKSLAVIPLRQPKPAAAAQSQQPAAEGAAAENAHTGQIVGAIIIEQIESEIPRDVLAPRLDLVYEHSARALSNALDHNNLFLMPVWRTIGKSKWLVQSRQLPKTLLIGGGILLLLLGSLVIPANFDMRAKGTLQPIVKKDIFAVMPGEIVKVLHDNGELVPAGEPLIVLHNPDLELKMKQTEGELTSTQESYRAIAQSLISGHGMTEGERLKAQVDAASASIRLKNLQAQAELLKKRHEQLTIRSPIAGRVITWDAKKLLQNRAVETGQVLLTVAAEDSDYEVELYMPERRMEHLRKAREKWKQAHAGDPNADLGVDFILMTAPGVYHTGKVIQVNPTAEPHEEHGNMVRIRVRPDEALTNPRPGATVTADVHCGRAPILWAYLHEAWEWVEANLLF